MEESICVRAKQLRRQPVREQNSAFFREHPLVLLLLGHRDTKTELCAVYLTGTRSGSPPESGHQLCGL